MKEPETGSRVTEERSVVPAPEYQAVSLSRSGCLANAAKREAADQENTEKETRSLAPEAYRLSDLPESVLNRDYRDCDAVMALFWRKFGEFTEREFDVACAERRRGARVRRVELYDKDMNIFR